MAVTPQYGWDLPDDTDLVKDGALAIRTLGNAIDASMNTALGTKPAGLVKLGTNTFTTAGTIDLPSIFNATYRNYTFQIEIAPSTSLGLRMNLKSGSTDITTATYYSQRIGADGTAVSGLRQNLGYFAFGGGASGVQALTFTLYSPNVAIQTNFDCSPIYGYSTVLEYLATVGQNTNATAYDGIKIVTSSGTITGRYAYYGWN